MYLFIITTTDAPPFYPTFWKYEVIYKTENITHEPIIMHGIQKSKYMTKKWHIGNKQQLQSKECVCDFPNNIF